MFLAKRAALIVMLTAAGCQCTSLRDDLVYRCERDGGCQAGKRCNVDSGYCEPSSDGGTGGGSGGGGVAGGSGGGSGGGFEPVDGGFVWENPRPFGYAINAMAADRNTVLAVGDYGLVLSRSGAAWTREEPPTNADLYAVAISTDGQALLAGANGTVLLRSAGPRWELLSVGRDAGAMRAAAWHAKSSAFYVAGDGPVMVSIDSLGVQTQVLLPATAGSPIRGLDEELTFVTPTRVFVRSDGGWVQESSFTTDDLYAVAGRYAAGRNTGSNFGLVSERSASSNWVPQASSFAAYRYRAVASFVGFDGGPTCFAIGDRGVGYDCAPSQLSYYPFNTDLDFLAAAWTGTELLIGGRSASVAALTSTGWSEVNVGVSGTACDSLIAASGTDTALWAGSTSGLALQRQANGAWKSSRVSAAARFPISGISVAANGDVWLVGSSGAVKAFLADGGTRDLLPGATPLYAVAATPTDVWVAGNNGYVAHWSDAGFTTSNVAMTDFRSLVVLGSGADAGGVYLVGGQTFISASGSVSHTEPGAALLDVWAAPGGDVVVVGKDSTGAPLVLLSKPSAPGSLVRVPTPCLKGSVSAVAGTSVDDLWVIESGRPSRLVRIDGAGACDEVPVPFSAELFDVVVTEKNVWVFGRECAVLGMER